MRREEDISAAIYQEFTNALADNSDWKRLYEGVVVSAQRADHPGFSRIHDAYPEHWLPGDVPCGFTPATVISYGIYFTEILADPGSDHSPKAWVAAKYHFRELSDRINNSLQSSLPGGRFASPFRLPDYNVTRKEQYYIPAWSERHIAYACGLGTFGLHQSFITDVGCNLRLSSLLTDVPVTTSRENIKGLYDNCLYYTDGSCRLCVERCPVAALNTSPKDIDLCAEKATVECHDYNREVFGIPEASCGLCMIDLPCSRANPVG